MDFTNRKGGRFLEIGPISARTMVICLVPVLYTIFVILWALFRMDPSHADQHLGDFYKDYYWAKAFLHGVNPYDVQAVSSVASHADRPAWPYLYMPPSLAFFFPFTLLSYANARIIACLIYAFSLLATLLSFSRRIISKNDHTALFFFFAVLAFNGAIYKSISTGNIASLESALVLLSLIFWLNGRHIWFLACIFAASLFKLTPLFFLVLIFFEKKPRVVSTILGLAGFALVVASSFLMLHVNIAQWIPFFHSYLGGCMGIELGFINPSMFCLLTTAAGHCHLAAWAKPLANGSFAIWVAAILYFSVRAAMALFRQGVDRSTSDIVVLALLTYALVMPRLLDCGWVILIPAVFRVLMASEYAKTIGPLMVLCMIPQREDTFPVLTTAFKIVLVYSPVTVAFGAWLLQVLDISKRSYGLSPNS